MEGQIKCAITEINKVGWEYAWNGMCTFVIVSERSQNIDDQVRNRNRKNNFNTNKVNA